MPPSRRKPMCTLDHTSDGCNMHDQPSLHMLYKQLVLEPSADSTQFAVRFIHPLSCTVLVRLIAEFLCEVRTYLR